MKDEVNINLRVSERMLRDIDDFRFKNRFQSRTEAIRWLIGHALKQNPKVDHATAR